uniref:hypothetical protein n=1 Tax=Anaerococcus mediterraneensis TaxID=1870984 RepID=UPI000931A67D|nr:hypothetical protein [Anaerococcus mediterraneensis]
MKNKLIKSISILIIGLAFAACDSSNTQAVEENKNIENVAASETNETDKDPESIENDHASSDDKEVKTESIEVSKKADEKDYHKEDGRYSTSLIASLEGNIDEFIGPTMYGLKFDGDYIVVSGSLSYRKNDEDYTKNVDIEKDEEHRFKVSDETLYQAVGGTADPEVFDKEGFIKLYEGVKESGLALIVVIENGVAKTVYITS